MCGITGFVNFSHQPDKKTLDLSLKQIIHRGPDSGGSYIDKHVALGIRRLSIIDLQTGNQPISNEDGTITVVFNGEIYNYLKLRESLIRDGYKFKTKSDTEVLVHLYEKYGSSLLKFLNGMFGFAIWDKKKNELFLARDHVGIKPMYFYKDGDFLAFGSEVKTILKSHLVNTKINEQSLALYSYLGYVPGNESIYKNIHKLLPGESLSFSKAGIKINQYYNPLLKSDIGESNGLSLEELFKDSISLQSIADVPLGVFLSGGLDSSIVTYYLSQISKKVKTFSISFKDKSFNEGNFAIRVAKILKTEHYNDYFSAEDVRDEFENIHKKLDEPFADPSLFPTFKVSKFARKYVKVVLSGDGGDELFGGYPTYQGQLLAQASKFIPSLLLNQAANLITLLPSSFKNYDSKEVLLSLLRGLPKETLDRQLFWMSLFSQGQNFPSIFNPERIKGEQYNITNTKWFKQQVFRLKDIKDVLKTQVFDFNTYLVDDLLVKVDRASMFNSLEVRVPFLDPRIIQYAYTSNQKHVDFFSTKKLLRNMLKDKFPNAITKRKKKGFGIPIAKWLCDDLYELGRESLDNEQLYDFYDKKAVSRLWHEHQSKKRNNAKILWTLIMFSGWLRHWG